MISNCDMSKNVFSGSALISVLSNLFSIFSQQFLLLVSSTSGSYLKSRTSLKMSTVVSVNFDPGNDYIGYIFHYKLQKIRLH